jgi:hypothetical protein
MSKVARPVLLIDGVPGDSPEEILRHDGPLGIVTECGLGRRPKDQDLDVLLRLHGEAAAAI